MTNPFPWLNPFYFLSPVLSETYFAGVWRCPPASESQDSPRIYKPTGDTRRFAFDLGDIEEIVAGQTIEDATIAAGAVNVSNVAIGSYRVAATFSGGTEGGQTVTLTATLSGGGIISRTGILVIS